MILFHRYGNKERSLKQRTTNKNLTKIIADEVLLKEDKRQQLLQDINQLSALEPERYDSLCFPIVRNLVNHCQNLPETLNSYYSQPGGFLDHALNRTEAALTLFKQFLILNDSATYSEEQKLWQYALLSAALLQGIGKLYVDLQVELFDNNSQFLKQWNPLLENLSLHGSFYAYEFKKESDPAFRRRCNLVLAKMLMPDSGFAWIASNPQVLKTWLALLDEDPYSSGTLGAILVRANAIALQRYFNQLQPGHIHQQGGRFSPATTFNTKPTDLASLEQMTAVGFLQWLYNALEKGIIMINKAPLLMVPGGMIMCPEIFKLFIRSHPEFKNWQAAQAAFLSLNMHQTTPDGQSESHFEQKNTQHIVTGYVFTEYAFVLPDTFTVHDVNTGENTLVSAIEFTHQAKSNYLTQQLPNKVPEKLAMLNLGGKWQHPGPEVEAALEMMRSPGSKSGG